MGGRKSMETEWVVWMHMKRMEWIDGVTCVFIAILTRGQLVDQLLILAN